MAFERSDANLLLPNFIEGEDKDASMARVKENLGMALLMSDETYVDRRILGCVAIHIIKTNGVENEGILYLPSSFEAESNPKTTQRLVYLRLGIDSST